MEQNCTAGCLSAEITQALQWRVQQNTYFAEFWVTCYIPRVITSQNYEWNRESKLKCHFVITYLKEHIPFSCKKCIQLNSLSGAWLFHITANFWLLSGCVHKQWKLCFVTIFCIARVWFSNRCMGIYQYSVDAFWGGYVISWLLVLASKTSVSYTVLNKLNPLCKYRSKQKLLLYLTDPWHVFVPTTLLLMQDLPSKLW